MISMFGDRPIFVGSGFGLFLPILFAVETVFETMEIVQEVLKQIKKIEIKGMELEEIPHSLLKQLKSRLRSALEGILDKL